MRKRKIISIVIIISLISTIFIFSGCEVTPPDPVLADESFDSEILPSSVWTWQSDNLYSPELFDDNGNNVLKLSSSSELIGSGSSADHPHYSGFGFNGGPNERNLNTSWDYEIQYKVKVVEHTEGWSAITFRYYGPSFDDRTTFGIHGLNTNVYSYTQSQLIDLGNILTGDEWHIVKIISNSGKYTVYIDNVKLFEETDSPVANSNAVWEVAGGMIVYFDDISIIRTDI